jgi:hypothetical protein
VPTDAATNGGRATGSGAGDNGDTSMGAASGSIAIGTQASAQSSGDLAGQQGHFGASPSWWLAMSQR